MKILVLSDNFVPEIAAPSFRVQDHAREWLARGHEVTVVTGVPNWPHGRVFAGYENRLYQEEWIGGIRVIRLGTYMTANRGFVKRTLDYMSFMIAVIAFCWRFPRFDVILATSPQFFTAVAGWIVSVLRRRPWIFEVRDLWPASIKAVGASQGPILTWLERLECFLYRRADRIITLTHAFKQDLVRRGISPAKIDVVTNGVNGRHFAPRQETALVREQLGIPRDAFLAGYIGTTGMAHGLDTLLAAAARCRNRRDMQFLIMGEGAERVRLENHARQLGLDNVHFSDRVPHSDVPRYYAALDLSIVHLKPDPVFRTVIPSKLFELMAMEVPIVLAVEGEAAKLVGGAQCGICVRPGDPAALAAAVARLAADPETRRRMGRRGRSVALRDYTRSGKAEAALQTLQAAIAKRHGRRVFVPAGDLPVTATLPDRPTTAADLPGVPNRRAA